MQLLTPVHTRPEASWASSLTAQQRSRALDAARLIAERVTRPQLIEQALQLAQSQTHFPLSVHWNPASVAQGDAGQALLCAQLDSSFPDEGWDETGQEFLTRAVQFARSHAVTSASVVSGLSGVAFAAKLLSAGDRHRRTLDELERSISSSTLALVAEARAQSAASGPGMPVSTFDVISGLSGTVTYLLPLAGGRAGAALPFAVRALAELALAEQPGDAPAAVGKVVPAWRTPVELLYDDDQMRQYPYGNFNCGLAHGIPGPLAALSLAWTAGQQADRVRDAIEHLADWLVTNAGQDSDGPRWPAVIPTEAYGSREWLDSQRAVTRDAWCYGSPGVARALYLAGVALDRDDWRQFAIDAMAAVYRRPAAGRGIDSPIFCHGVAGLLQISLRFSYDTGLPMFDRAVADLTEQLLAAIDLARPMAVANIEPGGNLVDQPGVLDGATGVCLTLLSAAADEPPAWDRIFALA